jgi:hypothetical protein
MTTDSKTPATAESPDAVIPSQRGLALHQSDGLGVMVIFEELEGERTIFATATVRPRLTVGDCYVLAKLFQEAGDQMRGMQTRIPTPTKESE